MENSAEEALFTSWFHHIANNSLSSANPKDLDQNKNNNNQSQDVLERSANQPSTSSLTLMLDEDMSCSIHQEQIYENLKIVNPKLSIVQNDLTPPRTGEENASPATMTELSTTAGDAVRKPSSIHSSKRLVTVQGLTTINEDRYSYENNWTRMENPYEGMSINSQTVSSNKTLPGISSSLDEMFKNMNLPPDLLSFFDDTNRDDKQDNDPRISTPESSFVETEDHIYGRIRGKLESSGHDYDKVVNINESAESNGKESPEMLPKLPQRSNTQLTDPSNEDPPLHNGSSGTTASLGPLQQNHRREGSSIFYIDLDTESAGNTHNEENEQQSLLSLEATVGGSTDLPEPQPNGLTRSCKTRLSSKVINALKRKQSPQLKVVNRTALETTSKPLLSERLISHKNGTSLHSQPLTINEVPVMVDKCINFIYAYGSMSEGIYRKSGSSSQINKILQLFEKDAFAVHLSRAEFSEYDVATALRMFIEDIPDSFFGKFATNFVSITSLQSTEDKISSYQDLLSQLPNIEYATLKMLIGHLSFIVSLEKHNKTDISNLSMIWGSTLMANSSQHKGSKQDISSRDESSVVTDLIKHYKSLFGPEEVQREQLVLKILQKQHVAVEDLSDTVKHSGDLMVWIKIECDPETTRVTENEESTHINVTITPTKTAADICKELAHRTLYQWFKLTLYEVIGNGALTRPVHHSEKALEIVLKWTNWNDADRKNNYLAIRPTTTLNVVFRHIQQAPLLSPTTELKFADQQTKTLRSYKLQLIGRDIGVFKQVDSKKYEQVMTINLGTVHAFLGREEKRDQSSLRWAITLVEHGFQKRTRESPYIGHILGGSDFTEQILWYSSILHSLHPDDILPSYDSTWL